MSYISKIEIQVFELAAALFAYVRICFQITTKEEVNSKHGTSITASLEPESLKPNLSEPSDLLEAEQLEKVSRIDTVFSCFKCKMDPPPRFRFNKYAFVNITLKSILLFCNALKTGGYMYESLHAKHSVAERSSMKYFPDCKYIVRAYRAEKFASSDNN